MVVPDLAASGLAVAVARHVRLVLAELPVEGPLPGGVPLVSVQWLPGRRALRRADPHARLEGGLAPVMCGIAGIVQVRPARARWTRRASSGCATCCATAARTARGCWIDGPGRARPPAAGDRRRGGRPPADGQRGRHGVDRLQRRDLQPRRAAAAGSRRAAIATARAATPRRSCTSTRRRASAASSGCSGMFAFAIWDRDRGSACSWRATGSASSRCTTRSPTDELLFASEIKALLAAGRAAGAQRGGAAGVPGHALRRRRGDVLPGVRKLLPGHTLTWSPGDGLRDAALLAAARRPDRAGARPPRTRRASCAARLETRCAAT